jgi:hypothetical protein
MFNKSISIIILGIITSSTLTACGNSTAFSPIIEQPAEQVTSESILGVSKEIKNSSKLAFKELDKNADKMITPQEYGVATPDSAKAFYAIDKNHDGKIVEKEFTPGFFSSVGLTFRLKSAAAALFKLIDKSKDKLVSKEELASGLVSQAFITEFDNFDKQQKTLFHKDANGFLSQSEFENLFAHLAMNQLKTTPADPATPAPTPAK